VACHWFPVRQRVIFHTAVACRKSPSLSPCCYLHGQTVFLLLLPNVITSGCVFHVVQDPFLVHVAGQSAGQRSLAIRPSVSGSLTRGAPDPQFSDPVGSGSRHFGSGRIRIRTAGLPLGPLNPLKSFF